MTKFHSTSISRVKVEPHLLELIDRCGGNKEAAAYASIGINTIYRILNKNHNTVQHKTATKILTSLKRKREEDRVNRSTHQKLTDKQMNFARIERSL